MAGLGAARPSLVPEIELEILRLLEALKPREDKRMHRSNRQVFPFAAIVGQDEMTLALICSAVDPSIGGVLVFGDRGTGKSTAVRALAALLPPMRAVVGCRYACDPSAAESLCEECSDKALRGSLKSRLFPVPVVDMPLGVTEDRVVGALDLERALFARG